MIVTSTFVEPAPNKQEGKKNSLDSIPQEDYTQKEEVLKPFENTIDALSTLHNYEAPMIKLEFMYQVFHTVMVKEIDRFWNDVEVKPEKLEIDYENLNGIAIYLALKCANPYLLVDILFVESYVSNAVMATNRAFHMTVLLSALKFIEETLPDYYEGREKVNPILAISTPSFNYHPASFKSHGELPSPNIMNNEDFEDEFQKSLVFTSKKEEILFENQTNAALMQIGKLEASIQEKSLSELQQLR